MPHFDAVLTASLAVAVAASLVGASPDPAPLDAASPEAAKLKCPPEEPVLFPDAPDVVTVLDAEAVPDSVELDLNTLEIESIEIVCATELHEVFGIEARRSGVVVFTAPGPISALRASLDSISELQKAHLDEHGLYARDLSDLDWDDPSGLLTVELDVSDDGLRWDATGEHAWRFGAGTDVTVSGEASPR